MRPVRLLIWGIVGLSGLAFAVQMIGVHGSTDEQAAIRHAVRAPFRDFRRRDALALCEDFTPAVATGLTGGRGSCRARVSRLFRLGAGEGEYVPAREAPRRGGVPVEAIARHGDRATASSPGEDVPGQTLRWRLSLVQGRWRIATPYALRLRSNCSRRPPFGAHDCLGVLTLRPAAPGGT